MLALNESSISFDCTNNLLVIKIFCLTGPRCQVMHNIQNLYCILLFYYEEVFGQKKF